MRTASTTETPSKFLDRALALVESASIRSWATSTHNRPIWESAAAARLKAGRTDINHFAASIASTAIGL